MYLQVLKLEVNALELFIDGIDTRQLKRLLKVDSWKDSCVVKVFCNPSGCKEAQTCFYTMLSNASFVACQLGCWKLRKMFKTSLMCFTKLNVEYLAYVKPLD